ncbi:MAG: hypothetical protein WC889_19080 [Myxococcota bacterium]|jgi:hypothetical protein
MLLLLTALVVGASADIRDFPVRPMMKTFEVTEAMPLEAVRALGAVKHASLRIIMKGNMLRDDWIQTLNSTPFEQVELVLGEELNKQHARQMKQLKRYSVAIPSGAGGLPESTTGMLESLGPVRKTVMFRTGLVPAQISRLGTLKDFAVMLDARDGDLEKADLELLEPVKCVKRVVLKPKQAEAAIKTLKGFKGWRVIVDLGPSLLDAELAVALNLSGLPVVFRVPDSINEDRYRTLFEVQAMDLEVVPSVPDKGIKKRLLRLLKRSDP